MIKENDKFKSFHTFEVYTKSEGAFHINQNYILPVVNNFFLQRKIINYTLIENQEIFNDLDFFEYEFEYFYDFVLSDIKKLEDGSIDFKIKYIISFDKIFCNDFCDVTKTFYKALFIDNYPCLYFIYIDFHDLIKFSRLMK